MQRGLKETRAVNPKLGCWPCGLRHWTQRYRSSKSFYDVGGDSLSAIGLALNMERAGFDGETARAIFDGATISDIAEMMVATQSESIDEKSPCSSTTCPHAGGAAQRGLEPRQDC
ncbi:MAG: acyl carrier protein [Sphingomonadales bacterium]|nr:acyl carrier protein [Sphingomonadales bacterium]